MQRTNLNDLQAFLAIAREGSFTSAAARLGVTPSALSYTMRSLEERLGMRLLARTTRSVTPTQAGDRLLHSVGPLLDQVESELAGLSELRDRPSGNIRITADEHAVATVLQPALRHVLPDYPDISVEIVIDYGLTDIVAERFDAGVRLGGTIAKDMIAVPIGPDMQFFAVAAPAYLADRQRPKTPGDLTAHNCINLRLPTHGGLYAWEFEKNSREVRVRVEGQLVFNSVTPILRAALDGLGVAYLSRDIAKPYLDRGELVLLLADWSPPSPGYHIYYPSRRQPTPAFRVILDALRYRA
jgi:DNA-binding transcriptional LysR family regulator